MSEENVEVVRKPLRASRKSRRTLDQRLWLRFPGLAAALLRRIVKLPPSSRFRQAVLRRAAQLGLDAYNRRDLDAVVIGWDSEFEYCPGRDWVRGGLAEPSYRGLEGYRRYVAATAEVWGRENYLEPVELLDAGDRIVILADGRMRAQASGVPLTDAFALVMTVQEGSIVRLQEHYDHNEALEAAGLRE